MTRRIRDYDEDYITNHTPARLGWKLLAVGLAIMAVLCVAGFVIKWATAATDVVSPANVKAQWQFAYDYQEQLNAIAANWCTLRREELSEQDPSVRSQRTSQRLAVETLYATRQAEFDGRLADAFRGKVVAPPDVPRTAEPLPAKTARLCPESRN